MAKRTLHCPKCGLEWTYPSYFHWILKAPFHCFNFIKWKDKRRTKCPVCGEVSWLYSKK